MGRVDPGDAGPSWEGVLRPRTLTPEQLAVLRGQAMAEALRGPPQTPGRRIPRHLVGTAPSDTGTLVVAPDTAEALARLLRGGK